MSRHQLTKTIQILQSHFKCPTTETSQSFAKKNRGEYLSGGLRESERSSADQADEAQDTKEHDGSHIDEYTLERDVDLIRFSCCCFCALAHPPRLIVLLLFAANQY